MKLSGEHSITVQYYIRCDLNTINPDQITQGLQDYWKITGRLRDFSEITLRLRDYFEITLRLPDYLEITGLLLRLLRLRQDYRDYFGITDQHVRDFFELFTPRPLRRENS